LALLIPVLVYAAKAETVDGRRIVIIDGDTIDVQGERIRILNIDAPESFRSRCEAELKLALKTRARLADLVRSGPVEINRQGQDRYRRTLAKLSVRRGDVGSILVREGLALPWQNGSQGGTASDLVRSQAQAALVLIDAGREVSGSGLNCSRRYALHP